MAMGATRLKSCAVVIRSCQLERLLVRDFGDAVRVLPPNLGPFDSAFGKQVIEPLAFVAAPLVVRVTDELAQIPEPLWRQ